MSNNKICAETVVKQRVADSADTSQRIDRHTSIFKTIFNTLKIGIVSMTLDRDERILLFS